MAYYHDVQTFVGQAQQVASAGELHVLMQDVTREMGFDHFALVHHVDLKPLGGVQGPMVAKGLIALSDYPEAWMEEYVRDCIVRDDPVLLASQRSVTGFGWSRVGEMIQVTSAHRLLTERTRKAGIVDGFTVPANVPGEPGGSCNFAVGPRRAAPHQNFLMAQLVGSFAFEAARTLAGRLHDLPGRPRTRLTPRLRDCIELVARGKSDWEIASILGLSQATVTTYMQRAREIYDVPTRVQVVLAALYDGEIGFSAIR